MRSVNLPVFPEIPHDGYQSPASKSPVCINCIQVQTYTNYRELAMRKVEVSTDIYWIDAPEAGLFILCCCSADSVKHLIKKRLIRSESLNGTSFETRLNAILLSDLPLQNERFSNLAEFPVLQMFYRQGLIIPNHPNNTGIKQVLLGSVDQVKTQAEYIYRGNYGLTSEAELVEAGMNHEQAAGYLRMKQWFAYGKFRNTDELLELSPVGDFPQEIRGGLFIERSGFNQYTFSIASSGKPWILRSNPVRNTRLPSILASTPCHVKISLSFIQGKAMDGTLSNLA